MQDARSSRQLSEKPRKPEGQATKRCSQSEATPGAGGVVRLVHPVFSGQDASCDSRPTPPEPLDRGDRVRRHVELWGEAGRDSDFEEAVGDPDVIDRAFALWQVEMDATDALVAETEDLGTMSASATAEPIALREVLVHLIEEYARHCGHADLLRERIDGRVGQ